MFRSPITIALLVAAALTVAVIGTEMTFANAPVVAELTPACQAMPAFSAHNEAAQWPDASTPAPAAAKDCSVLR